MRPAYSIPSNFSAGRGRNDMLEKGFRTCYDCKKTLPVCRFRNGSTSPQGNRMYCDACTIVRERKQAVAAREKRERRRKQAPGRRPRIKRYRPYKEGFMDRDRQDAPVYNFCTRYTSSLCMSLKNRGLLKENVSLRKTLGTSPEKAWEHLLATYEINYGEKWAGQPYEMDHIIPICTTRAKKGLLALYHYTNLQMLTPEDNRSKNNDSRWKSSYQKMRDDQ